MKGLDRLAEVGIQENHGFMATLQREVAKGYPGEYFTYYIRDDLVGVVGLRDGRLIHLYVHPNHRSGGIGRRLVQKVLDCARAQGLKSIRLVAAKNAVTFYEELGFVHVGADEYVKEVQPCDGGKR